MVSEQQRDLAVTKVATNTQSGLPVQSFSLELLFIKSNQLSAHQGGQKGPVSTLGFVPC